MANPTQECLLQARCTRAEHEAAKRLAEKRGFSVADLLRALVREADQEDDVFAALLVEQREANNLLRELVRLAKGEPTS